MYEDEEAQTLSLNTLSFTYTFEYDNDVVYFSYFQPYTFGDLKDHIYTIKRKYPQDYLRNVMRIQKLCDSMLSNPCYVLSITENVYETNMHKQVVYITSRVHPGESNSSFMCQGVIDFLL